MSKDLRTYLNHLHKSQPKEIKMVDQEIDRKWEVTALVEKLKKDPQYPNFPAILFTNIKGCKFPLLINLCGNYQRLAFSIDSTVQTMVPQYAKLEANPIAPLEIDRNQAPVKEVVWTGDQIDLDRFPAPWHNELDAGYFIAGGTCLTKDPENQKTNVGIYRHQIHSRNEVGLMISPAHHGGDVLRRMQNAERPLEVAIVIGHHPTFLMSAVSRLAGVGGELGVCGGLMGEPLEMVSAESVDLLVPARAEIVIEGLVDTLPEALKQEGPFGEYPHYYTGFGPMPWIKITAITMRKNPIFQTVFSGHIEHTCLGALPKMGGLYRRVRAAVPSATMVNLPISGMGRSHAYISIKKARDGEPKLAAFAALATDHLIKHVFVVDDDVDVFDETEVLWCMCTRFQADRDLSIIPYTMGGHLAPNCYDIDRNERADDRHRKVMETKMILDLTKPAPPTPFPPRCGVPEKLVENADLSVLKNFPGLEKLLK